MTEAPGIEFQSLMAVEWQSVNQLTRELMDEWARSNVALLRALATIEGAAAVDTDNEPVAPGNRAIERLEAKIDLALKLLNKLLEQQRQLPERGPATLSASKMRWITTNPPNSQETVVLSVHLSDRLPEPLVLPATITDITSAANGVEVTATFVEPDEELTEWLERTIFRYHRRAIQSRQTQRN